MNNWCGTVDPISSTIALIALPFMLLYLLGLWVYCKATGKMFLEQEQKEVTRCH